MTISQRLLYVSGYAAADTPGIHAFTFDAPSASLTARWSFSGIVNPSFIVVHPNGRWLHAASEKSQQQDGVSGAVWSLALPDAMGEPQTLSPQMSVGDWPCHLALDAPGRWLLVSNSASHSVAGMAIGEN